VLLAGAGDELDFRKIRGLTQAGKKQVERLDPHQWIGVDFALRSAGEKAARTLEMCEIFPEIDCELAGDFSCGRVNDNGGERLGGRVEA
jgi:hypothetical protein